MDEQYKETEDIITEGIYYSYIDKSWVDLYKIKYNLDNDELLDIECLTSQTGYHPFDKDFIINYFKTYDFRNPIRDEIVSYKLGKNVELLIDTICKFYSNINYGIRDINHTQKSTRLFTKLTELINSRKLNAGRNDKIWH